MKPSDTDPAVPTARAGARPATPPAHPAGGSGRVEALDLLRGIAIIGTLGTNIWLFTHPLGPASAFLDIPEADSAAGAVEVILRALTNGKFLALLTILFGVGIGLQYRSALRRGRAWPGRYPWRATLLLLEGVLHYVLVFEFDVLMGYALVSMIVVYLLVRGEVWTRVWLVGAAAAHLLLVAAVTAAMVLTNDGSTSGEPAATPEWTEVYATGSWADQIGARLDNLPLYRLEMFFVIPMGIALFLVGTRLLRAGAFDRGERGDRLRRRLVVWGLGAGVPLNAVTAFAGPDWFLVDRYVAPPLVALGLLGLITGWALRTTGEPGVLRRGVTAVGRTALSCYVFQNLAASALCYGWGAGLAVAWDGARPWWPVLAWAGIVALCMAGASSWLRRFDRGPLELLWHAAYTAPRRGGAHRSGGGGDGTPAR